MRLLTLLLALPLLAAVPPTRDEPEPPTVEGTWECDWRNDRGEMEFLKDGRYHHKMGNGSLFVGDWRRSRDGELIVHERFISHSPDVQPGEWVTWWVTETWKAKEASGITDGSYGEGRWAIRPKTK